MAARDEFAQRVIEALRERVGGLCSNPECRCPTTGPNAIASKSTRVGVAAHICAAAPGGPRFDQSMSSVERASASNGIWLCANCSRRVDSDVQTYSRELMLAWKVDAETEACQQLGKPRLPPSVEQDEFPYICPHCHSGFSHGQTICRGCHGQIVEGATSDEQKTALAIGVMGVLLPLLAIYGKLNISLFQHEGGILDQLPLLLLVLLSVGAGGFAVMFIEKRRRSENPRVFVRTIV